MSKIHEINATAIQNIETRAQKEQTKLLGTVTQWQIGDSASSIYSQFKRFNKKTTHPTMNEVFKSKNDAYCLV